MVASTAGNRSTCKQKDLLILLPCICALGSFHSIQVILYCFKLETWDTRNRALVIEVELML
jgi:hypothetical protein